MMHHTTMGSVAAGVALLFLASCGEKPPEPAPAAPPPPAAQAPVAAPAPEPSADQGKAVVQGIRRALAGDEVLSGRAIDVTVTDGVAHLWGTVASNAERNKAEQLARSVAGVDRVDNRLKLVSGS